MINKDFERMKEIEVDGKLYIVSFLLVDWNLPKLNVKRCEEWICAYVILKGKDVINYEELDFCTYNRGNVYGVDTAHYRNFEMSIEEKFDDSIRQIKELIRSFNKY